MICKKILHFLHKPKNISKKLQLLHLKIYMYRCLYVCMYVCMYVYMYVDMYGYVCICVYRGEYSFVFPHQGEGNSLGKIEFWGRVYALGLWHIFFV